MSVWELNSIHSLTALSGFQPLLFDILCTNLYTCISLLVLVLLDRLVVECQIYVQDVMGVSLIQCAVEYVPWASHSRTPASVTKRYKLVSVEGG